MMRFNTRVSWKDAWAGTTIPAIFWRSAMIAATVAGATLACTSAASSSLSNRCVKTTPNTAMASSPAKRDIALLIPEAVPARSVPTEFMTVVVSGATVTLMPKPSMHIAGKNVAQ